MFPSRFLIPFAIAAAALPAVATPALAPAPPLEPPGLADYQHTAWTAAEGAPARISDLAQTADGWLWLGTPDGLFRFDGLRFEHFPLPPLHGLVRDSIHSLYAAPNGDLYVAYFSEGASVVHPDGRVEHLPAQESQVRGFGAMALDGEGSLWTMGGDVRRLRGGKWEIVATGAEWRGTQSGSMLVDGRGQLWAANDSGAWRLDRASGRLAKVAGGGALLLAPDGRLWLAGSGGVLRLLDDTGARRPPSLRHAGSRWFGLFDEDGGLWTLNCPQPVCLAPGARPGPDGRLRGAAGRADGPRRASGNDAQLILEDREGDIWVVTENGLDRSAATAWHAPAWPDRACATAWPPTAPDACGRPTPPAARCGACGRTLRRRRPTNGRSPWSPGAATARCCSGTRAASSAAPAPARKRSRCRQVPTASRATTTCSAPSTTARCCGPPRWKRA